MKNYLYSLLTTYIGFYCLENNTILEIKPKNNILSKKIKSVYTSEDSIPRKKIDHDYVLLNGSLHYEQDIQVFLQELHGSLKSSTRVVIVYYSSLWRPLIQLATFLKLRKTNIESNWIAHEDIDNFLLLSDYELIRRESKIICPVYIPIISNFLNRYVAPLPFFNFFTLINVAVARPKLKSIKKAKIQDPSVSIIVAARNEEGNIKNIIKRIPKFTNNIELIFIEGHSKDATWETILTETKGYKGFLSIKKYQQDGKGKGDAVRKGFSHATNDILMILDADLTVPPEDLPKFYKAIRDDKGEYINGSRLVYPMEKKAMRFFNLLGNKFFAISFSFVLGQKFKDTLCGTKVISRQNYLKLASNRKFFGDFDPFGDFDLIFGSARMGLKIVEIPISYKERTYGETNISRWSHGLLLLRMLIFAGRKIKFI